VKRRFKFITLSIRVFIKQRFCLYFRHVFHVFSDDSYFPFDTIYERNPGDDDMN